MVVEAEGMDRGSGLDMGWGRLIVGCWVGLTGRGDGLLFALLDPILCDLEERGEGGECWRQGKDRGEYIMLVGEPVTELQVQARLSATVTLAGALVWLLLRDG